MYLQSGKWYFVTMATELLKKRMSSNMRIPVLMATAILHIWGEKMCPVFFLWVEEGEGELSSIRFPSRIDETLRILAIVGSEAGHPPPPRPRPGWKHLFSTRSHNQCFSLPPVLERRSVLCSFCLWCSNLWRRARVLPGVVHTHLSSGWGCDRCRGHSSPALAFTGSWIHSCDPSGNVR